MHFLYLFIGKVVTELLKQHKDHFDAQLKVAQFGDGKEFYNVGIKALQKHEIG